MKTNLILTMAAAFIVPKLCAAGPLLFAARRSLLDRYPGILIPIICAIICVIIGVIILIKASIKRKLDKQADAQADAQYKKWCHDIAARGGDIPVCEVNLHLAKGEVCYFKNLTAELYELRAVRDGRAAGTSVRVMKGVTIHSGGFKSESHDEWRKVSMGALYVTNKRIIFDGELKNRIIPIADVMSVVPDYRKVCVNSHKIQKPLAFGSINGQIFADIVNALYETE